MSYKDMNHFWQIIWDKDAKIRCFCDSWHRAACQHEQRDGSSFCLEKKKERDQEPNNTLPTHIRAHTKRAVVHVFSRRDRKSSAALWLADFLSRPRYQKDPKPTRSRRHWEENHSGNTRRVKPFNAARLTEPPHCQLWSYCKITLKFTVSEATRQPQLCVSSH